MEQLKIPCGPIFNIKQAVENPQVQERNMIIITLNPSWDMNPLLYQVYKY